MFPEMKSELGVVTICAVNTFRQRSHTMNEGVSSRYVFVFLLISISYSHFLILLTGPCSPAETCVSCRQANGHCVWYPAKEQLCVSDRQHC